MNVSSGGAVLMFTGEGKGKTTAALGLALRLAGHGRRVLILELAKGEVPSGECRALERLGELIRVVPLGRGRLDLKAHPRRPRDLKQVRDSWDEALRLVDASDCDAVVLDEVVFLVSAGFLPVRDVLDFLDRRPPERVVVLTGRGEVEELVERADYVTVMKNVKHPFDRGVKAAPGIEF